MKVKELMERIGTNETGRAIAYIKDGLEEMNILTETHIKSARLNIVEDKRFYDFPSDVIKMTDIRVKNHLNTDDQWRSIPRMIGNPLNTDKDEI